MNAKKLDKKVAPILEEIEKEYNRWSILGDFEIMPGNIYYVPELDNSIQVGMTVTSLAEHKETGYSLQEPSFGFIKDRTLSDNDIKLIMGRAIIGYSLSTRIISGDVDPTCIKTIVKSLVNQMVRERGFGPDKLNRGCYLTFKKPGTKSGYFREIENSVGYELRIWSCCVLAERRINVLNFNEYKEINRRRINRTSQQSFKRGIETSNSIRVIYEGYRSWAG